MTVCAAAVYMEFEKPSGYGIFTVSDRMLTEQSSGRVSEPAEDKVFPLSPRSRLLSAGDILDGRPLWEVAQRAALSRASLAQIVATYQEQYIANRQRLAELLYLHPHGLTLETWAERQGTMNSSLVLSIAQRLEQPDLLDVDTIICGFDERQEGTLPLPHLYRIEHFGRVTVHDTEGVVAVGAGSDAVYAEFQLAGYVRTWNRARTLRLLYSAKKKAESIASVGRKTDLFEITPDRTQNRYEWLASLEEIYENASASTKEIERKSNEQIQEFLGGLT